MKIKQIGKYALMTFIGILVLIICVILIKNYREQWLKDNIYSEMQKIFSEKNIHIKGIENDLYDDSNEYVSIGYSALPSFEYNEKDYVNNFRTIDGSLVNTSNVLMEFDTKDEIPKTVKVYGIVGEQLEYKLAVEMNGTYYQYVIRNIEHNYLDDYIDIIGPRDELQIENIKVTLMDGMTECEQYIYGNDAADWVWETLLGKKCKYIGHVACTCCGGYVTDDNVGQWVEFDITIKDIKSNGKFIVNISECGTLNVYDGRKDIRNLEYKFNVSELLDSLKELVDNYEAYKVQ